MILDDVRGRRHEQEKARNRRDGRLDALVAVAVANLGVAPASAESATLVVDRDGAECASAHFTSIRDAVNSAAPGDVIRVCPDIYEEKKHDEHEANSNP